MWARATPDATKSSPLSKLRFSSELGSRYKYVMARLRKRHVQQSLALHTWGGKRKGAGRPQTNERKSERHRVRPRVRKSDVLHVTLRVVPELARLRRRAAYAAIRRAANVVLGRSDFRVVHISIQANHVHLLVEAEDKHALASGMKAFQVSAARRLNVAEVNAGRNSASTPRKGSVFVDRYHSEIIDSPRRARHALAYVLNNWRRHKEDRPSYARTWAIDPFSTAAHFDGWSAPVNRERPWTCALDDEPPLPVARPETWLLREGWKRHGPIRALEVPGPR
jgi:REP element-mobilizing transposase RayT